MSGRVVYVIGFSAPPVLQLHEFVVLLQENGWDPYVILSPTAATWVDVDRLARVSGHPVRVEPRTPTDPDPWPPAEAIVAAPLTFNSLNKWAAGISDNLPLGLLNEALGLDLPIVVGPVVKEALRGHPAYGDSVGRLSSAGVTVLDPTLVTSRSDAGDVEMMWGALLPSSAASRVSSP